MRRRSRATVAWGAILARTPPRAANFRLLIVVFCLRDGKDGHRVEFPSVMESSLAFGGITSVGPYCNLVPFGPVLLAFWASACCGSQGWPSNPALPQQSRQYECRFADRRGRARPGTPRLSKRDRRWLDAVNVPCFDHHRSSIHVRSVRNDGRPSVEFHGVIVACARFAELSSALLQSRPPRRGTTGRRRALLFTTPLERRSIVRVNMVISVHWRAP